MKSKEYRLLEQCLRNGLKRGWKRAHKNTDAPTKDEILDSIHLNLVGEIVEYFSFAPDEETV